MPHKEILRLPEVKSRDAFLLILTILMFMIIGVVGVDAADEESMWNSFNENGAIELILADTFEGDLHSTVEYANNTVEQAQNQEVSFPQVEIPTGVNVRGLSADAATLSVFPRGNANVIGWFNATSADAFGRTRAGVWFVVENDGRIGAVHGDLVDQTDGTDLTPSELAAAGVPQYAFEGGVPTAPAAPEGDGDDEASGDGDGDDDDETGAPTGNEDLVVPEVPSSFTVSIDVFENGTIVQREVTVTPNPEEILPTSFGIVDLSQFPDLQRFAELLATRRGGNRTQMDNLRSIGIHAVYVGSREDSIGNYTQFFAIPRNDGTWVSFQVSTQGDVGLLLTDGSLNAIQSDAATNMNLVNFPTRFRNERITLGANDLVPGDSAVVFVYSSRDTETGEEDQGPYAQGQRGSCGGRNTDEIIDYLVEDNDNACTLSNGLEISGAALNITGIAASNE